MGIAQPVDCTTVLAAVLLKVVTYHMLSLSFDSRHRVVIPEGYFLSNLTP